MTAHRATDRRAVGVFDSGVGGLSILRAIRRALPDEDLIYVADSAHAPYGDRDAAFIAARATVVTKFLLAHDAKAIVVACNTASSLAVQILRAWCPVPIIGLEPAIGPATRLTRTGVVGVLATTRTIASPAVARLCATYGHDVRIVLQACPGLVEDIERGEIDGARMHGSIERYLAPLLAARADAIVLGCTHYAFLEPVIRAIAGPDVDVVDSADAVARQVARRLRDGGALREAGPSRVRLFSNAGAARHAIIRDLWGAPVPVENFDETREVVVAGHPP